MALTFFLSNSEYRVDISSKHVFLFFNVIITLFDCFNIKFDYFFIFIFQQISDRIFYFFYSYKFAEFCISTRHNHICCFLLT